MVNPTFQSYSIDLGTTACGRLLAQFKFSTDGIQPFITAQVEQTQDLNDITVGVFSGRDVDTAIGVQLDVIGDIVGQPRPLVDGAAIIYFRWDGTNAAEVWDGTSTWFTTNAPTSSLIPALDATYRRFIYGKIFKNQVTGASIPEALQFVKTTLDIDIGIVPVVDEVMTINLVINNDTPASYIALLLSKTSDNTVENDYFIPIPIGVKIKGAVIHSDTPFAFDSDGNTFTAGWDSGLWSVTVPAP